MAKEFGSRKGAKQQEGAKCPDAPQAFFVSTRGFAPNEGLNAAVPQRSKPSRLSAASRLCVNPLLLAAACASAPVL